MYIYTYMYAYIYTYTYSFIYVYMYTHIYTYIYMYICIYVNTHMHTYIYVGQSKLITTNVLKNTNKKFSTVEKIRIPGQKICSFVLRENQMRNLKKWKKMETVATWNSARITNHEKKVHIFAFCVCVTRMNES